MAKNLPAVQETWVWYLGQKDPLEKETATYCSILAWRVPWTEDPGGLQSIGSQRVGHNWATNTFISDIIEYLSFSVWLISLNIRFCRSILLWKMAIFHFCDWRIRMQLLMNFTQTSISNRYFYLKSRTKMSNRGKRRKWRSTFLSSGLLSLFQPFQQDQPLIFTVSTSAR